MFRSRWFFDDQNKFLPCRGYNTDRGRNGELSLCEQQPRCGLRRNKNGAVHCVTRDSRTLRIPIVTRAATRVEAAARGRRVRRHVTRAAIPAGASASQTATGLAERLSMASKRRRTQRYKDALPCAAAHWEVADCDSFNPTEMHAHPGINTPCSSFWQRVDGEKVPCQAGSNSSSCTRSNRTCTLGRTNGPPSQLTSIRVTRIKAFVVALAAAAAATSAAAAQGYRRQCMNIINEAYEEGQLQYLLQDLINLQAPLQNIDSASELTREDFAVWVHNAHWRQLGLNSAWTRVYRDSPISSVAATKRWLLSLPQSIHFGIYMLARERREEGGSRISRLVDIRRLSGITEHSNARRQDMWGRMIDGLLGLGWEN